MGNTRQIVTKETMEELSFGYDVRVSRTDVHVRHPLHVSYCYVTLESTRFF